MGPSGCDGSALWKESKIKRQNGSGVVYHSFPAQMQTLFNIHLVRLRKIHLRHGLQAKVTGHWAGPTGKNAFKLCLDRQVALWLGEESIPVKGEEGIHKDMGDIADGGFGSHELGT